MNTLNSLNEVLIKEFAEFQNLADATQACRTLQEECDHLYYMGIVGTSISNARVYLPQLSGQLTGVLIPRIDNVITEELITVYPEGAPSKEQSLNDSLKMVALHSVLLSGFTAPQTVHSALVNWIEQDSINIQLDCEAVAMDLITAMIKAEILSGELGKATTDDGAFYDAYGVTPDIQELRIKTMRNLWERAQPRMQPMRHKITWKLNNKGNATCEIKNLKLMGGKSVVSQEFVDAANKASHVGYMVNNAIRADLDLWLELGQMPDMPEDTAEALKLMNRHEDKTRIVEELLLLPTNEVMYFPHTADWRGRFYARGGLTQFQSIKECKAIFDFAESSQITDPKGLYLHVANAHGMDKVSITDRINWVRENQADISAFKLSNDIYAKRSAIALNEYLATGETAVICHIDGTCNGTQWTSAIYRDSKTAKLVNVRESNQDDTPFDLYGVIAERAKKLTSGAERAALDKFGRAVTKYPIMVLGYGASEKTVLSGINDFLSENAFKANAKKLHKAVMTAIKLESPAVTRLTNNLRRQLAKAPRHTLTWQAFDLTVKACNLDTSHLDLHGTSYNAKVSGKALPDEDSLMRGLSPNYVHSLDSAHLRAVIRSTDYGLSCIHDSVGCPANKVMETNQTIRTEFYNLNQIDLVENIYNALGAEYTAQNGNLDIKEVLEASYIFS